MSPPLIITLCCHRFSHHNLLRRTTNNTSSCSLLSTNQFSINFRSIVKEISFLLLSVYTVVLYHYGQKKWAKRSARTARVTLSLSSRQTSTRSQSRNSRSTSSEGLVCCCASIYEPTVCFQFTDQVQLVSYLMPGWTCKRTMWYRVSSVCYFNSKIIHNSTRRVMIKRPFSIFSNQQCYVSD